MKSIGPMGILVVLATLGCTVARGADLGCNVGFTTKESSALCTGTRGEGVVYCSDGSSLLVGIAAEGHGVMAGEWEITDGRGRFSRVDGIDDALGRHLPLSGDVGMAQVGVARFLAKASVAPALAVSGQGVDIGIAVGTVEISRSTGAVQDRPARPPSGDDTRPTGSAAARTRAAIDVVQYLDDALGRTRRERVVDRLRVAPGRHEIFVAKDRQML